MGKAQKENKRANRQAWQRGRKEDFSRWESIMRKVDNKLRRDADAMKKGKRKGESK